MNKITYGIWDLDENRWYVNKEFSTDLKDVDYHVNVAYQWFETVTKAHLDHQTPERLEWSKKNYPNGPFTLFVKLIGDHPAL